MKQWEQPMCGTLRISNPRTLQSWMDKGWYQQQLDNGWIFAPYCGRFRSEPCTCSACRNKRPNKDEIIKLLNNYGKKRTKT